MNFYKIAKSHADIWFYHDAKKYLALQQSAKSLFSLLKYNINDTNKISHKIRLSYFFYDKAVESHTQKRRYFEKANSIHKQVMQNANFEVKNGENYTKWWINFSKKKYVNVFFSLFNYHWQFIKGWRKIFVPLLILFITLAGCLGHNQRNKNITIFFLSIYWAIITIFLKNKFIIY